MEKDLNKSLNPQKPEKNKPILRAALLTLGILSGGVGYFLPKQENQVESSPLEKLYLDESARAVLIEWLRINGKIDTRIISRGEWNKLKGEFLLPDSNNRHVLYLPLDLKTHELIRVIRRIDKFTYGDNIPTNAQSEVLFNSLQDYIQTLKNQIKNEKDENIRKKMQQSVGTATEWIRNIYEKEVPEIKIFSEVSEQNLANSISYRLFSTAFSHGVANLGDMMKVYTKNDFDQLSPEKQKKYQQSYKKLSVDEKLLRTKIGISGLKKGLENARKNGDKKMIAKEERLAIENIHTELANFPWDASVSELASSSPTEIIDTKKLICVGYSILAHSYLQELGIKHNALSLMKTGEDKTIHSGLRIYLSDDKEYYFDPQEPKLILTDSKKNSSNIEGVYSIDDALKRIDFDCYKYIEGDPQNMLMAELFGAKGVQLNKLGKYKEATFWFDRALKLFPQSPDFSSGYAAALGRLELYSEALPHAKLAHEKDPKNEQMNLLYRKILYKLKSSEKR